MTSPVDYGAVIGTANNEPAELYDGDLHAAYREVTLRAWRLVQVIESLVDEPKVVDEALALRAILHLLRRP